MGMASRPDGGMIEVELVEDDGVVSRPPDARVRPDRGHRNRPDGHQEPSGAAGGRAARWALSAAVLATIAGGAVVLDGREAVDPETAGVLAMPFVERWATSADEVQAVIDGVVVVSSVASAQPTLRGIDSVTGEQVWSVGLSADGPADTCTAGVTREPPTAWCWRERHWVTDVSGQSRLAESALVGIDVRDGSVVHERVMLEPTAGHYVVDDDLVLGQRRGDVLTVRRVHPENWRPVWSTQLPLESRTGGPYRARIEVAGRYAVIRGQTTAVLSLADGRVLGRWVSPDDPTNGLMDGADVDVAPGGFSAAVIAFDGARLPRGTWYDKTGSPLVEYSGRLAEPTVSDGSVPDVLLVTRGDGGTLVAVDVAGGADLWSIPLTGGRVVARRDGLVVVMTRDTVRALELLTGVEVWSRDVPGVQTTVAALSDGRTVVAASVRDGAWALDALRIADGQPLWFAEVPGTESGLLPRPEMELVSDQPFVLVGRTLISVG